MNKNEMIREAIKMRLKQLGLSQKDLADALKLTHQNLNAFLTGKRNFPLEDIERICKYLNLELKPIDK